MSLSDGIIACWDAGGKRSYPGTGDKWSSPVNSIEATLYNSSDWDFVNEKMGFISFDGTNDLLFVPINKNSNIAVALKNINKDAFVNEISISPNLISGPIL